MKVGWLQDPETEVIGGAELTCRELLSHVPPGVEVVPMPSGGVARGMDVYVVQNCTSYREEDIPNLKAPVVKYVHDVWPHGDPNLRWWLCHRAQLLIWLSPLQRKHFHHDVTIPEVLMPPAMDLRPFREAAAEGMPRADRTLWLGQMTWAGKGIDNVVAWASQNGVVDFYGAGPFEPAPGPNVNPCGQMPYHAVPALMAQYRRFVHLPSGIEAFSRTVIEAAAAGCEVATNTNVGAAYWAEHPDLERGAQMFWSAVLGVP